MGIYGYLFKHIFLPIAIGITSSIFHQKIWVPDSYRDMGIKTNPFRPALCASHAATKIRKIHVKTAQKTHWHTCIFFFALIKIT
jgi:hypothetical protein